MRVFPFIIAVLFLASTAFAQVPAFETEVGGSIPFTARTLFRAANRDSTVIRLVNATAIDSTGVYEAWPFIGVLMPVTGTTVNFSMIVKAGYCQTDGTFQVAACDTLAVTSAGIVNYGIRSMPPSPHFYLVFEAGAGNDAVLITDGLITRDRPR